MNKPVILCVDDEKDILDILLKELDVFTSGYEIELAENSSEALEIFEECASDDIDIPLIISDFLMPGMKGDQLLIDLHKKQSDMVKILLTGQATLDGVKNAYENANLYRYIAKPWEEQDLILTIREALKSYTNKRELKKYQENLEKKVEERTKELARANQFIRENSRKRTNFFINLAHEIRTPIHLILNHLNNHITTFTSSDNLDVVTENFSKLQKFIEDYFTIEQLNQGKIIYRHKGCIVDINLALEKIKELVEPTFKTKNIAFFYEKTEPALVEIDNDALDRILNNLIYNAYKYTPVNGNVRVELLCDDHVIEMRIKDSGPGIAKEQMDSIFDPFSQLSRNKKQLEGVGMGLAIVKGIVTQMEGEISVNSTLGQGAEFIVRLKKYTGHIESIENIKLSEFPVEKQLCELVQMEYDETRDTVLIIEDRIELLVDLQTLFHKNGYSVLCYDSAESFLANLSTSPLPNVIISDIMLDDIDGIELFKALAKNERYKTIPFIFMSAKGATSDILEGLEMGVVDYFPKPFKNELLLAKVKSLLKLEKKLKENKLPDQVLNKLAKCSLSNKEHEIALCILKDMSNKEIAERLSISESTVRSHQTNCYTKAYDALGISISSKAQFKKSLL